MTFDPVLYDNHGKPVSRTFSPQHDVKVRGIPVCANMSMDDSYLVMGEGNAIAEIKNTLALNLARYMIDNSLVEFTKDVFPHHFCTTYKARCLLVKAEDIKYLRDIGLWLNT